MTDQQRDAHIEAQTKLLKIIARLLLLYGEAHDKHYCLDHASAGDYYADLRNIDSALLNATTQGSTDE